MPLVRTSHDASFANFAHLTDKSLEKALLEEIRQINERATDVRARMSEAEQQGFVHLLGRYLETRSSASAALDWDQIQPPSAELLRPYAELPEPNETEARALLSRVAVLKLNGGLGTSMGCSGPKSVIEIRSGQTFLDIIVKQIESINKRYQIKVPLLLMNSFNTDADTLKVIRKYEDLIPIRTFQQSRYPRLVRDTLRPLCLDSEVYDKEDWYPPGHGDMYDALLQSGMLDRLLAEGKEWIFVSNSDNLGASLDTRILKAIADHQVEFTIEMATRTRSDRKGGTLITYQGKPRLLEVAQVDKEHLGDFQNISKFRVFNTNSLWIQLKALKRIMDRGPGSMELDIIPNTKTVKGETVLQLETAMGAAITHFQRVMGINVPRSRFLPVKTTSDLLLIQSNLYNIVSGYVSMNPERPAELGTPVIRLGPEFKKVSDFSSRFESMPDILELESLTVSGSVRFGKRCKLSGTVIIVAQPGASIDIPAGSRLENCVVTGNLHVLDV
ncbi:UTP--glucose-1-phosphate uridylyltransferase [Cyanidioschyzon merolae strain 10D]|uniref:UTP--glucose-1-phosphate uridylyltransferase n=1 Tax=Cyanidioschyzon merolae (strain NIES-3377 / 10D) TaxID=280699 RepID=M1V756_CYAM1|nr:UTP--glucose-1-phosphate uridylyltransferase [Cyanidioschyzon merolae strain 10D]BAM82780.1 UTP--glucose-1-phosphate uridylyltransferase [Cyanidioschyzon merolae strain 10D]|eukprot:XP_005538816.1 UTP--glucose-1-phosphate uridylyltransferase [Cyanidioschyzon merolae strain 10D]